MKLLGQFTLLTFLFGAFTAEAAFQCRSALLIPPTQEQIRITLDSLARLTLEVDLAKYKSTDTNIQLEADLKLKQNEVMIALGLDRSGLRKQLFPRIQALQKKNKSFTEETTRLRQVEEKNLGKIASFKKTQDIPFPQLNIRKVLTATLPEITLVVKNNSQFLLYTYNVSKNSGDYISGFLLAATINANKKTIYGINDKLEIEKFQPGIQRSVAPPVKISDVKHSMALLTDNPLLEVSPGEKYLALHIGSIQGELYIIRIADGEVVHHLSTGFEFEVKFLSDNEFYVFDSTSIEKHNLSTKKKVKIENLAPKSRLQRLWLDSEGQNLIHASSAQMTILDPLTLEVKSSLDMPSMTYLQMQMPKSDRNYLAFTNLLPEIFDYTSKDRDALFTFNDPKPPNTTFYSTVFTDDGNHVLFFTGNNNDRQLSIWTREN